MSDTKKKILLTALNLFAQNGYEAVSTGTIAGELGITKGALYKHYKNKRDIFDSIIRRMEESDAENAKEAHVPEGTYEQQPSAYKNTQLSDICIYSKKMFDYWTAEEFPCLFRRMLTIEQYRSAEISSLYQQYLASGPLNYLTDLFSELFHTDREKAYQLAIELYSPMFLLYSLYDVSNDKSTVQQTAYAHIEAFTAELLKKKGNPDT